MKNKLLYEDVTYKVRGAIFSVYNELGYGHKEEVYQKALAKELQEIGVVFKREGVLSVQYKNEKVGTYRPDFTVEDKVIIELKAVTFMPKIYSDQLLHYLKTTNYRVGLLVNFGTQKLEIRRLIWG